MPMPTASNIYELKDLAANVFIGKGVEGVGITGSHKDSLVFLLTVYSASIVSQITDWSHGHGVKAQFEVVGRLRA